MDRESSPEEGEIVVAPPDVPIKQASKAEEVRSRSLIVQFFLDKASGIVASESSHLGQCRSP